MSLIVCLNTNLQTTPGALSYISVKGKQEALIQMQMKSSVSFRILIIKMSNRNIGVFYITLYCESFFFCSSLCLAVSAELM